MKQADFQARYRQAFSRLDLPLAARHGIPERTIAAAEKKLELKLPKPLRDYFLVAGAERVLNSAFNRLVAPSDWEVFGGKLIFMVENQAAVVWGVNAITVATDDSVVFQAAVVKGNPGEWFEESKSCFEFLIFMLHLQAAYGGGMAWCASGPAPKKLRTLLDANWQSAGEINGMRTYGRSGQAVCFLKWQDLFRKSEQWRVFAGASSRAALDAIASDLNLSWDSVPRESMRR